METTTLLKAARQLRPGQCVVMRVPGVDHDVPVMAWRKGDSKPLGTLTFLWKSLNDPAHIEDIPVVKDRPEKKELLEFAKTMMAGSRLTKKLKFDLEWLILKEEKAQPKYLGPATKILRNEQYSMINQLRQNMGR